MHDIISSPASFLGISRSDKARMSKWRYGDGARVAVIFGSGDRSINFQTRRRCPLSTLTGVSTCQHVAGLACGADY